MAEGIKDLSHLHKIDIEIQSFCNRKCDWCPNKKFDRTFKEVLPEDVYINLIQQIKDSGFGTGLYFDRSASAATKNSFISFTGYQEAFSDPDLLKSRLAIARAALPRYINFVTNTNGDYLNKEALDNLLLTGIAIQDYDNRGIEYWKEKFKELGILEVGYNPKRDMLYGIHRYVESITVALNWTKNAKLENRGGFFKKGDLTEFNWKNDMKKRTSPCPYPDYYINIAYDGSVMPCCHMRPDNPAHKGYILGNIKDTPLIDIYYSEKSQKIREALQVPNGEYPEPCLYCQKIIDHDCFGSPSGWNYLMTEEEENIDEEFYF